MNEREIAAAVIGETLEKGFGNIALGSALGRHKGLSRVQKAFITELVNGTLRNLIKIDYIIGQFSHTKIEKIRPYVLNVLRISVYQIMFMDRVPDSAACNEAVKLVKKKGFGSLGGYTNGVLRNIARGRDKIKWPKKKDDPIAYLSIMYSYPTEIIKYWLETCDIETVEHRCRESISTPSVTAAVNTLRVDDEGLIGELEKDNVGASRAKVGKGMLTVSKTSDMTETTAYKKGYFHIMDQSSYICLNILAPEPGEKILDLCAAPGGKSFLAAYRMKNRGLVVSRDIHPGRVRLIKKGAERLGAVIIKAETGDASVMNGADSEKYDRVLADVPCSGLGIIRKKPDIKYSKTLKDIEALAEIQKKILNTAAQCVKPGGVLVYSTCTFSVKENEEIVRWFSESFDDFCTEDISGYVPEDSGCKTLDRGYINIDPEIWDSDGFFIARFRKKGG